MFGAKGFWGLDLGDAGVKAVRLRNEGKRIVIEDFISVSYAETQSEPQAERLELMARAVARVSQRISRGDDVVAGIPSENVLSRFIGLPPVDKRRIPEIVRYEARQQIPFDLSEVQWDYQRVRRDIIPGEEIAIGLFAVRREVINQYLVALRPVARQLVGIQINPLAVCNFVRSDVRPVEPLIVLDIGAKSTDLIVLEGPKFWIRNLPIAGNSFTQVLQKKFNITFEEAESVKLKIEQSKHRQQLFEIIRPVMHDLIGEIQRSIGWYKGALSRDAKFEEILVLGGGLRLHGLYRMMTEELQYRIRTMDKPNVLEAAAGREKELAQALPGLGAALGGALFGMHQGDITINLLPGKFIESRVLARKQVPAVIASGLIFLGAGLAYVGNKAAARQWANLKGLGADALAQAKQYRDDYERINMSVDRQRIESYEKLAEGRDYWIMAARALTDAAPERVTIDGLKPVVGDGRPDEVAGRIMWEFRAISDGYKAPLEMADDLVKAFQNAMVYPEMVPLLKPNGVSTGDVKILGNEIEFTVRCALNSAEEITVLRKETRQKLDAERAAVP